ncbi:glycosyl transferase [Cellvibrio zantedeschiae]|uniref:Glycosyl transferase n=1 Tax=Cellvibrio zantedeschiae TaxID=1237077 RepID=A0ABQ3AR94_9GAMM|nr:glycosyltransferase family 2 protein [Cellvibrio zantedeschiae]GGY62890.1 glycosyl transferase [Cellvibrio zantedeschiae]
MQLLSIVIPTKNEAKGLKIILPELRGLYPSSEIIVVNDGSTDETNKVAELFDVNIINHPYSKGNGAAIKSGLRVAKGDVIVCMDADGQHLPRDIEKLLKKIDQGFDMVVGARNKKGQANIGRGFANKLYNYFASWMVGHKVEDLTSGFRAVKSNKFREFLTLLPNKFSYPTTITMSFFRAGYSVGYVSVDVQSRLAGTQSHIRLWQDGIRFLLIIFKIGTLFSPLKLFFPISLSFFITAVFYYAYTFIETGRFTNMSALLFTTSVIVFLMGLISEQITSLIYKETNSSSDKR